MSKSLDEGVAVHSGLPQNAGESAYGQVPPVERMGLPRFCGQCRFLGLSPGYWLRAQAAHDTEVASAELAEEIERIEPLVAAQP